jgi:hypothetical protein
VKSTSIDVKAASYRKQTVPTMFHASTLYLPPVMKSGTQLVMKAS